MISDTSALLKLGGLFLKSSKLDKAEDMFRKYIELCENDFRGYFMLAKVFYMKGEQQLSLKYFNLSIRLNPTSTESYSAAAAVAIKLDMPHEAASYCRQGLAVDSTDRDCLYNINIALRQLNQFDDALSLTRSLLPKEVVPLNCTEMMRYDSPASVCVVLIKWGSKYGPEYVHGIANGLRRFVWSHIQYNIVCFTDDFSESAELRPDVEYRPLPDLTHYALSGWWYKAYLFSEQAGLCGRIVYLDLDTIICSETVNAVLEECHPDILVSTSTSSRQAEGSEDAYEGLEMRQEVMSVDRCPHEMAREPEREEQCVGKSGEWSGGTAKQSRSVTSANDPYVFACLGAKYLSTEETEKRVAEDGFIPPPAGVVCFPLYPKPHHIRDKDWVMNYWPGELTPVVARS